MNREKLNLKYSFECNPKDLFIALTKPAFLQKNWIAEKVEFDSSSQVYTFHWSNYIENAKIAEMVTDNFVRWDWVGGEHETGEYVSFRIEKIPGDELIDLHIEDFCDSFDRDELSKGWNKQIKRLEMVIK